MANTRKAAVLVVTFNGSDVCNLTIPEGKYFRAVVIEMREVGGFWAEDLYVPWHSISKINKTVKEVNI